MWIFIYFDMSASNTFYVRYSQNDTVTGIWSDQITLYTTTQSSEIFNYAGHAYPGYDPSGKTVVLSWTYNLEQTKMARVTFELL